MNCDGIELKIPLMSAIYGPMNETREAGPRFFSAFRVKAELSAGD